jgi:hypothetical protein
VYSWAMHRVTAYLTVLRHMLPRITEGSPLSNVLDHCMVRVSDFRVLKLGTEVSGKALARLIEAIDHGSKPCMR